MGGYHEFLAAMAHLSADLKQIGAEAGIARGAFIRLVTRVARQRGLRDWPHTRTPADYHALIAAVRVEVVARSAR